MGCGKRVIDRLEVDGEEVVIREACDDDKEALIRFYESLRAETIYARFFTIIKYFQPYVERVLSKSRSLIVVAETGNGKIVGVAEAVADDGDAESGIAVLEAYQGKGIGKALARAIVRLSGMKGFRRLYGYIMTGNYRAYRLARRFGARIVKNYGDMLLMEIPVGPPNKGASPGRTARGKP